VEGPFEVGQVIRLAAAERQIDAIPRVGAAGFDAREGKRSHDVYTLEVPQEQPRRVLGGRGLEAISCGGTQRCLQRGRPDLYVRRPPIRGKDGHIGPESDIQKGRVVAIRRP
jgi:hypothetical protein